jgi:hypothetical protein
LSTTLKLLFQFTQAAQELMIKLALTSEFIGFSRERARNFAEFFGEPGDDGLRRADELRRHVLELIFEAVDQADDSVSALGVHAVDVSVAQQVHRL